MKKIILCTVFATLGITAVQASKAARTDDFTREMGVGREQLDAYLYEKNDPRRGAEEMTSQRGASRQK